MPDGIPAQLLLFLNKKRDEHPKHLCFFIHCRLLCAGKEYSPCSRETLQPKPQNCTSQHMRFPRPLGLSSQVIFNRNHTMIPVPPLKARSSKRNFLNLQGRNPQWIESQTPILNRQLKITNLTLYTLFGLKA